MSQTAKPREINRALTFCFLLTVAAALALRCPQLGVRPMHNDEAVNAIKVQRLWEKGSYQYDAQEFHGPTLIYLASAWINWTGVPDFTRCTEADLRFVTLMFGVGLIFLLPLVEDGLGPRATLCAALLTAISPAMVFYSRYFIHEMLLVFFTFLMLAAAWRYTRSRQLRWALLAGAALGLMQATKETFVLPLAAMVVALVLNRIWDGTHSQVGRASARAERAETSVAPAREYARPTGPSANVARQPDTVFRIRFKHLAAAAGIWFAVVLVLFSSFFTNAQGPLDAVRTYLPWLHRAGGASPHNHPWDFYLARLAFFHAGNGPVWSEGLILALAALGLVAAFARQGPAEGHAGFVRFLAFYTVILTVIYSAIGYKTPWCLLGFWHGMILLAGVGTAALFRWLRQPSLKIAAGALLAAGAVQLASQAWSAGVTYAADPANPYVYSQTSPNILELVNRVVAVSHSHPDTDRMVIQVMAPESDYGPLLWYLRQFSRVGWWSEIPKDPYAPVMIVSTKFHAELDAKKTHIMVGIFQLRPGVFFELYVEAGLWREHLDAAQKNNAEPTGN